MPIHEVLIVGVARDDRDEAFGSTFSHRRKIDPLVDCLEIEDGGTTERRFFNVQFFLESDDLQVGKNRMPELIGEKGCNCRSSTERIRRFSGRSCRLGQLGENKGLERNAPYLDRPVRCALPGRTPSLIPFTPNAGRVALYSFFR